MSDVIELDMITKPINKNLIKSIKRERDWWFSREPNLDKLVEFPDIGEAFRLIYRLRKGEEPKLGLPSVLDVTNKIGEKWREKISDFVLNPADWYLSVTSLYRGEELQRQLTKETPNAFLRSTHQYGAAIDFDPNGFYLKNEGNFLPVNLKTNADLFFPKLTSSLSEAISSLPSDLINFVSETLPSEESKRLSCFHVCVSPEYQLQDNSS